MRPLAGLITLCALTFLFVVGCLAAQKLGLFGYYHASNAQTNWAHSGEK
jgi:hypothetical protein